MQGLFGLMEKEGCDCTNDLFVGTAALMSRGQLYGGMSSYNPEEQPDRTPLIRTHKGLFKDAFKDDMRGMESHCGIGLTSYNRQPIWRSANCGNFTIGLDGYIINAEQLRYQLFHAGHSFGTLDDVELIATLVGTQSTIGEGLEYALKRIAGTAAIIVLTDQGKIYAARDTAGKKPLMLGKRGEDEWAIASESAAFNNRSGFNYWRDVAPGEVVEITQQEVKTICTLEGVRQICSFEWVYWIRFSSSFEGIPAADVRHRLGGYLAEDDDVEADYVGPFPFSGIGHCEGYHLVSGIPSVQIYELPQFILRTYDLPPELRVWEKSIKLTPVVRNIAGKRLIVVDDSIRSGITCRDEVQRLYDLGALEVHLRIASPISVRNCPYAPPPKEVEEYIAAKMTVEEIRRYIGATTLKFQPFENIPRAIGLPEETLCCDCHKW